VARSRTFHTRKTRPIWRPRRCRGKGRSSLPPLEVFVLEVFSSTHGASVVM
jgi:hypothetical protein